MKEVIVMIKFKQAVAQTDLNALTSEGATVLQVYSNFNWVTVKIPVDKISNLRASPDIDQVEYDQTASAQGFNDATKFNLPAASQTIPYGITKIRADQVWPEGDKGTGVKVCVIDTGIDVNHPDVRPAGGYNFITNDTDYHDDNGHGTHVSGTIAALDNDIGVVGAAPEAAVYAFKVLDQNGSGSYSNIVAAIDRAIDDGMDIISMSLGGTGFSQALKDACDAAYGKGILLIAAAGNSGGDGSTDTVLYPARFDSVIAVAATDSSDARASFSSCGPEVEVSAPGVSVLSTVPTSGTKYSDPSGYKSLSGTSMATPHVSGTAALVMKKHPELTNVEVRDILGKTAVHLGTPGRNVFYGFGRIDAKAAVDNLPPQPPVLTSITVSPSSASVIVGATQQFKATAFDQYNNPMPSVSITWAVDNTSVGTVNPASGVTGPDGTTMTTFTAAAAGSATVTAASGSIAGTASVTVTEQPPVPVLTSITVSPATVSLIVGAAQQFRITALDQSNNPMPGVIISVAVDNPVVGSISPPSVTTGPDGSAVATFTALAAGNAVVTASSGGVAGRSAVTVTAPPPEEKKFRVKPIGVPGHLYGATVVKVPNGNLTATEACKAVCAILQQI